MNRSKLFCRIFFLVILVASSGFASRCFWWTISSSADVWEVGENVDGVTVGQISIGPVGDSADTIVGNYGFWNDFFEDYTLAFQVYDTSMIHLDSIWAIRDSLWPGYTASMISGEQFVIVNEGNCHIGFGLEGIGTSVPSWEFGWRQDMNKPVVRAQFDHNSMPPIIIHITRDFIKNETIEWADSLLFGPEGYDLELSDY